MYFPNYFLLLSPSPQILLEANKQHFFHPFLFQCLFSFSRLMRRCQSLADTRSELVELFRVDVEFQSDKLKLHQPFWSVSAVRGGDIQAYWIYTLIFVCFHDITLSDILSNQVSVALLYIYLRVCVCVYLVPFFLLGKYDWSSDSFLTSPNADLFFFIIIFIYVFFSRCSPPSTQRRVVTKKKSPCRQPRLQVRHGGLFVCAVVRPVLPTLGRIVAWAWHVGFVQGWRGAWHSSFVQEVSRLNRRREAQCTEGVCSPRCGPPRHTCEGGGAVPSYGAFSAPLSLSWLSLRVIDRRALPE